MKSRKINFDKHEDLVEDAVTDKITDSQAQEQIKLFEEGKEFTIPLTLLKENKIFKKYCATRDISTNRCDAKRKNKKTLNDTSAFKDKFQAELALIEYQDWLENKNKSSGKKSILKGGKLVV
jgi:hypothetical protein